MSLPRSVDEQSRDRLDWISDRLDAMHETMQGQAGQAPTPRDRFAMAALAGKPTFALSDVELAKWSHWAYAQADALLKARGGAS